MDAPEQDYRGVAARPAPRTALRSGADRRPPGTLRRLGRSLGPCLLIALFSGTRFLVVAALLLAASAAIPLAIFRHVDPPGSMVMAWKRLQGEPIVHRWVALSDISPHLVRAVIMSEDSQFCRHYGVDLKELLAAIEKAETLGDDIVRGASTISMQTIKNLLLWSDRSYARKAIELPVTLMMEQMWTKARIMEVYLNIAEFGPGIHGAEAAARHHFRKPARRLDRNEAILLAVALPNPQTRSASRPSPNLKRVAAVIDRRVRAIGARAACVLDR